MSAAERRQRYIGYNADGSVILEPVVGPTTSIPSSVTGHGTVGPAVARTEQRPDDLQTAIASMKELTQVMKQLLDAQGKTPSPPAGQDIQAIFEAHIIETGFEDLEALVNMLLMLNTFVTSICISFVGSTFNAEDFFEVDKAFGDEGLWYDDNIPGWFEADVPDAVFLPSVTFATRGWTASVLLSTSLLMGIGVYLSLVFSNCREDKGFLRVWKRVFYIVLFAAWALFLAGFMFFFSCVAIASYARFPKYCGVQQGGPWTLSFFYISKNATRDQDTGYFSTGCIVENMQKYQGGFQTTVINTVGPVVVVGSLILTLIMHVAYYRRIYPCV